MRLHRFCTFALCLLLAPLVRAEVPGLYNVIGVAEGDVLNIRENPRASAGKIGELARDARDVEVVKLSESGTWGQVNVGERTGWVSLQFLAERPKTDPAATRFDAPLACFGTEPFWSLRTWGNGELAFEALDSDRLTLTLDHVTLADGTGKQTQFVEASGAEISLTGVLGHAECSDGMSGRSFALTLDMLLRRPDGPRAVSGCCSLSLSP